MKEKVIEIVADKAGIEVSEVKEGSLLQDDLGFDSLDFVELVMEIENSFKIKITDSEYEKVQTVSDIITLVQSKLA